MRVTYKSPAVTGVYSNHSALPSPPATPAHRRPIYPCCHSHPLHTYTTTHVYSTLCILYILFYIRVRVRVRVDFILFVLSWLRTNIHFHNNNVLNIIVTMTLSTNVQYTYIIILGHLLWYCWWDWREFDFGWLLVPTSHYNTGVEEEWETSPLPRAIMRSWV